MLQPENQNKKYDQLFSDIDSGRIKVPRFQREFVWTNQQTASLIDSIIKGFPIGSFILWQTRDGLRQIKEIGNIKLPEVPKGEPTLYVLDGQQRITSLYAVRKGARVSREGEEIDYKRIFIDLSREPDADDPVVVADTAPTGPHISVFDLLNASAAQLAQKFPSAELLNRVDKYHKRLTTYDFSTIVIRDYPIQIACEVFTRINTGGTELTLFEIMVAKTYDDQRNFDLLREYECLKQNDGPDKDLEDAGYETLSDSTVLQCIAAHINKQVRSRDILKLDKNAVIDSWPLVKDGIFAAVDYVRSELRIPVSRLLPYDALLVPLTYFFVRNSGRAPSVRQNLLLKQYFWWASLSSRFSSAVETNIGQDLIRIDEILAERQPSYTGEEVRLTLEDLRWRWFRANDAFCKAILCLYAFYEPKSFKTNGVVVLNNSWLRTATGKNYHHFFPKAYLAKQGLEEDKSNVILNITLLDASLNKEISAKAPDQYMKKYDDMNEQLADTMRTHIIDDLGAFGIWTNDYDMFVQKRGERVLAELHKRLNPFNVAASAGTK